MKYCISDCGGLSSPGNGSVSTEEQTTTYGQVANYTCNPGYTLIGEQSRTCQQDGNWSGSPPVCEVKGKFDKLWHFLTGVLPQIWLLINNFLRDSLFSFKVYRRVKQKPLLNSNLEIIG